MRMNRKSPCSLLASASWLPQPIIRAWTGKLPQPQVVHHAAKSGIADIPPGTYILGSKIGYASWPRLLGETPAKQVFFFGSLQKPDVSPRHAPARHDHGCGHHSCTYVVYSMPCRGCGTRSTLAWCAGGDESTFFLFHSSRSLVTTVLAFVHLNANGTERRNQRHRLCGFVKPAEKPSCAFGLFLTSAPFIPKSP